MINLMPFVWRDHTRGRLVDSYRTRNLRRRSMKASGALIGLLITTAVSGLAQSDAPVLSNIDAGHPALQSSQLIHVAGGVYSSGQVAYGAVGTPLLLTGSDFGEGGSVWFIPYKNKVEDPNASPVQAPVSLWSETAITATVPPNTLTGLIEVISGGIPSNGLPFVVIQGTYSGACRTGQDANPVQIVTDSLHDGAVTQSYSATLRATGGSNSYLWSLLSGSLPQGLSLNSSGVISGTPISSASGSTFVVQVADTSTPQLYDAATLSINISTQAEATSGAALYGFSIQNTGGASGYDPAGNLVAYTDSVNGTWTFTYDSLNRLATASGSQADNPNPNYCWQYDNFGNRLWQTSSGTAFSSSDGGVNACPVSSGPSFGTSYYTSNQIADGLHTYDGAGNMTLDSTTGNSYLYDAEGRICAVRESIAGVTTMTQYIYDAEGLRVGKGSISTFSCDTSSNGFNPTTVYVLGPGGEQLTELTNISGTQTPSWHVAHTSVYAQGQQIATYDADLSGATEGNLYFQLSDWLGSRRQQTDYAGNPVLNFTNLPYGDGQSVIPISTTDIADATEHHFTGKERDAESGNDYFGARYYASTVGRFMSPDPAGPWAADVSDPQSWNFYAYARNNPLINVDLFGYDCVYLNDAGTGIDKNSIDTNSNSGECGDHGGYWVDGSFTSGTVYSNNNDVYLHGYDSSTGQLTDSYSNVVTANGNSSINTDVFSGPNLFAYIPTQPLPKNVLNGMVHSLNRSGQSDKIVGCVIAGESSGRSGAAARPPSTAKGLMQVNNPTAGDIARWYRSDFGGMSGGQLSSQMTDPGIAITAGTDLLRHKVGSGSLANGLGNYYGSNDPSADAAYASGVMGCAQKP